MADAEGAATFRTSADAYDRHVGRYGPQLAAALIKAAGVEPGQRAIDVGCGPGPLTTALAELLGAENVAGVDPSEPFVAACRERAPGADIRLGSAEELPFEGGEFDTALAQLVVNFMTDAERGVGEMARVVNVGGVVAACVWDYADGMTMLRCFWDAAVALDPGAAELDEGRRMRYCRPGELRELWQSAGLKDVDVGELVVSAAYDDFDDFWAPLAAGVAPSGAYCASLDASGQAALSQECQRRLGAPDGPFELTAKAWYARGAAASA